MKTILLLLLTLSSAFALDERTKVFLEKNNITLVNHIEDRYVDEFLTEFKKFPSHLLNEMLLEKAQISLLQGKGVADDPAWLSKMKTWDGRDWSNVPGAGGTPYAGIATRIVVNRLRSGHGSHNLFLHEHAHALDNTYVTDGISNSKKWRKILKSSKVKTYLHKACGEYCLVPREAFAELFARYYDGELSKHEIKSEFPEVDQFFMQLYSIKDASGANLSQ